MTRKLTQLIAGIGVCIPASAFALGLGQIEVRSALNQPLDAEIPLLSVNAEELPGLRARLASSQLFGQYGIERLPLLLTLDFSVKTDAAGRHVIQVSSKQPIREPLINFLVQVDGADGQLLREYAVLLDLPTVTLQQPATNNNPLQSVSVQTDPASYASPVLNTEAAHRGTVSYGPVAYGDTLWDIAGRIRPDPSINRARMMQALLEANPEAFYRPDINSLSAGATLRVPSAQELDPARFSESTSRQLAQQQAVSSIAEEVNSPSLPTDDSPRVRLVPADAEQALSSTGETTDTKTPVSGLAPPFRIKLENDRPQLRMAGVSELRERLAELPLAGTPEQSDNTTVQRNANTTTEANGQTSSADLTTSGQSTAQTKTSTPITVPSLDTTAQEALPQTSRTQPPPRVLPKNSFANDAAESQTQPSETTFASESGSEIENTAAADVETVDTAVVPSLGTTTSSSTNLDAANETPLELDESGSGMLSTLLKNPISLTMMGALLLLLLALPVFLLARRQGKDDKSALAFEAITPEGVAIADAGFVAESESESADVVSEPVARTRTEPLAKTKLAASDANPLEQADLLIAVGNYKEAEQIVRRALLRSPYDTTLASKLLDVHFAAGNGDAFAKDAQLLRDRLGDESDPVWMEVVARGRELCPGNSLFTDDSGRYVSSEESITQPPPAEDVKDNHKEDSVTAPHINSGLPFDLKSSPVIFDKKPVASSEETSVSNSSQEPELTETRSDLEWVMPDMEPPTVATMGLPDEDSQQGDMELELKGLDFEFEDVNSAQETATSDPVSLKIHHEKNESTPLAPQQTQDLAAELKSQSDTLNFFLDSLDEKLASSDASDETKLGEPRDLEAEAKSQDKGSMLTDGDQDEKTTFIDFDQEEPSASEDYVQTKLDLAFAYMDMGDSVGARSLLQEVIREGTDIQKQRAEECVVKLG